MTTQTSVFSGKFAVLRDKKYNFSIHEVETWGYRSQIDSGAVVVFAGTEPDVRAYKTKGQLFKETNGYSRTRANLLSKYKTNHEGYKAIMKENRKKQRSLEKAKKDAARAGRKEKKVKTKGGKS